MGLIHKDATPSPEVAWATTSRWPTAERLNAGADSDPEGWAIVRASALFDVFRNFRRYREPFEASFDVLNDPTGNTTRIRFLELVTNEFPSTAAPGEQPIGYVATYEDGTGLAVQVDSLEIEVIPGMRQTVPTKYTYFSAPLE